MTLDVLLLAEVFRLDPGHYVSATSLSFDAMLRITRVKVDLLSNLDMYLFFVKELVGEYPGHRLGTPKLTIKTCQISIHK